MKTIKLPMLWSNKFPITITYILQRWFFRSFFQVARFSGNFLRTWAVGYSKVCAARKWWKQNPLPCWRRIRPSQQFTGEVRWKILQMHGGWGGDFEVQSFIHQTKHGNKDIQIKMPIGSFWMFLIFLNHFFSIVVRAEVCEAFLLPISKDQWVSIEMAKIVVMNTKGPTIQPFSRRTDHPSSPHNFWITQGSSNYPFYGNFEGFSL